MWLSCQSFHNVIRPCWLALLGAYREFRPEGPQLSQNVIKSQLISAVTGKGTAEPADVKSPLSNSTRRKELRVTSRWIQFRIYNMQPCLQLCSIPGTSFILRLSSIHLLFPSTWHTASIQLYFLSSVSLKGFIWISSFDVRISISVLPCVPVWLILKVIAVSGNMTNDK